MGMDTKMDGLMRLSQLADDQDAAEVEVYRIEMELATAKRALSDLAEKQIPEMMEELEVEEFRTANGLHIKVKETLRANLSKARKVEGLGWLRDNGHSGLIKTNVVIPFSKGGDDEAQLLVDRLGGEGIAATFEEKVNPQTLSAAVRTMLEEGEDPPFDLLGIYVQRVAKIQKK